MKEMIINELGWYADNFMVYEMYQYYETARRYLTIPELLEWYSLDDVVRMEYDIQHTELLQRDIEALWENRLEGMVKEP